METEADRFILLKIDDERVPKEYLFASLRDWDNRFLKTREQIKVEDGGYLNSGSCYMAIESENNDEFRLVMLPDSEPSFAEVRLEFNQNHGLE